MCSFLQRVELDLKGVERYGKHRGVRWVFQSRGMREESWGVEEVFGETEDQFD
jgi:hypothetical protein